MYFRLSLCLILAAVLTGCATQSPPSNPASSGPAAAEAAKADVIDAPGATLIVHGLSCPLCAENVGKSLMQVAGVASVDRDLSSGTWAVAFDADHDVTHADLRRAITRAGFTLISIEPTGGGAQ